MRKYWNIFGLLLVAALAVTESSSAAPGTITFNFSGTCTDCSGTATASLVLVGSYTLGTPITASNLVSFTYNRTNLTPSFTFTPSSQNFSVIGSMTNIPGSNAFLVEGNTNGVVVNGSTNGIFFNSGLNGNWSVGLSDQGTAGTWSMAGGSVSATPAPPTSILLLIGLMALTAFGVWQRRRKTA
jgi:MYXO-CTERM domain-containing protein